MAPRRSRPQQPPKVAPPFSWPPASPAELHWPSTLLPAAVRLDWDRVAVVPLDMACLDLAADLARAHPLRLSDALHLAAAHRLPRPVRFLTFDAGQIPVALALGFEVVST